MKHQLYLNCQYCHTYFEYNGGRRSSVCSSRCKVALWRAKKSGKIQDFDIANGNEYRIMGELVTGVNKITVTKV